MVIHLLLAHDIETNPGPQPMTQPQPMHKSTMTVVSLNCRGRKQNLQSTAKPTFNCDAARNNGQ